jgi:hypothetical protein
MLLINIATGKTRGSKRPSAYGKEGVKGIVAVSTDTSLMKLISSSLKNLKKKQLAPWPESASEQYRATAACRRS